MNNLVLRLQTMAAVALLVVLAGCDSDTDDADGIVPTAPTPATGTVEVIHASADAPPVNVLFDDVELISGADFKDVATLSLETSDSIRVRVDGIVGGSTEATVIPAGMDPEPAFPLNEGDRVSIIAWDTVTDIKPLVLIDEDPVVPADTVLSQDPLPGVTVEAGARIDIVVSAGTDAIEMPDVAGKSEADALFQLGQAGFQSEQIVIEERASDSVLEGFVIATIPEAGNQVASTSTITIIVSSGVGPIEVPDVVGMDLTTATAVLQAAGFEVEQGDVIEVPFGDEDDGRVIEQSPPAGTELEEGETVTIRIGASGEPVEVPDLIDFDSPLTLAEAETVLTGLGLVLQQGPDVEVEFGSDFDGRVSEQSPPPGTQVAPGETIIVSLGKAPEGVEVPDVVGLGDNEAQAEDRIEARGLVYEYDPALDQTVPFEDSRNGIAAATDPVVGTPVAPGSTVKVGFFRQEESIVPDVIGRTKQAAEDFITTAGLVFNYLGTCDPGSPPPGGNGVAAQGPDPATIVAPGSEVWFYIYELGAGACDPPTP